jgi:endoglycosylceramidase
MNFVRLGVMWEAVERSPKAYNMTYLDEVEKLINNLGDNGFHVLVDAHQDVAVRKLCGEGFPNFYATDLSHSCDSLVLNLEWWLGTCKTASEYGWRYDADGNPLIEDCQKTMFAEYYNMPESQSVFDKLYDNIGGMQDDFIAYWDVVSKRFAGNKYVIGYDPLNEPFPSSLFTDPTIMLKPGRFDGQKLQPMFKRAFERYQEHDSSQIMMFEGT